MLTVVVGLDPSGAKRTRKPLGKRYSEMPSTEETAWSPASDIAELAGFVAGAALVCA
jgi:hypothetical protein